MKDPVCGMSVDPTSAAAKREHGETNYYFCSQGCALQFDIDPERYLGALEHVATQRKPIPSATTGVKANLPSPQRIEVPILNLDCATCAPTIDRSLKDLDGVKNAEVNFATAKAHIAYDPSRVTLKDFQQTIKKAGYSMGARACKLASRIYAARLVSPLLRTNSKTQPECWMLP